MQIPRGQSPQGHFPVLLPPRCRSQSVSLLLLLPTPNPHLRSSWALERPTASAPGLRQREPLTYSQCAWPWLPVFPPDPTG